MSSMIIQRSAAVAVTGLLAVAATGVDARDRKECEAAYKPQVGQAGKDVVWVPTPDEVVQRMLKMAKVTSKDLVYDLGAGDGKIAIAAGKLGAQAVGIEYNPDMAKLAQCFVQAEGVGDRVRIIQGDVFKEDFSKATVVTMYLLPELNLRLRPTILNMRPGTRVTSHQFTMGDWEADETAEVDYRSAYLWIVPARVGTGPKCPEACEPATWVLREQGGSGQYTVTLNQKYQKLSGEVTSGGAKQPLVGATLRADEIRFAFNDEKGVTRTLTGTVRGNEINGVLRGAGGVETKVVGTRR